MSMRTETLQLVISGDSKLLGAELGKSEKKIRGFAGKAGGMFAGIGRGFKGAIGKLANPLALIGGSAGILLAARNLIDYQDSLSSLGITANMTAEDMMSLDKRIHDLAYTTGQSREKIVDALRSMASNVDTDSAVGMIEDVSKAATAMSMDIGEVAKVFTVFRRDLGATEEEAAGLFDTMMAMNQGTAGLSRIASSVSTLGLTKDNFAQYNALIQSTKTLFGGEEAAASAIDQIAMRTLGKQGRALRRRVGEDLFSDDGRIKDFKAFMERTSKVLNDRQLQNVFGAKNSRAFLHFQSADALKAFDDYIERGQQAGRVTDALAWKQREAKFQLNALSTAAKEFAGAGLSPVLADITKWLTNLTSNDAEMQRFREDIVGIATALGDIGKTAASAAKYINRLPFLGDSRRRKSYEKQWKQVPSDIRNELNKKHGLTFSDRKGMSWNTFDQRLNELLEDYQTNFSTTSKPERQQLLNNLKTENKGIAHKLPVAQPQTLASQEITVKAPEVNNTLNINLQIPESGRPVIEAPAGTSVKATVNRGVFK
ncbi:MAG: hypothetical protein FWE57_04385 [Chitinispirillia bacterium]|nr:hypothetical protein [Chitinispirillia bacterium]